MIYTPPMRLASLLAAFFLTTPLYAQWQIQDSHTTADLRGIHSLGGGVAWASGSHGTVLRTEDSGTNWQVCAIPPGAEKLDFRGVQGFDANTAIVMSSGKGDLSRLYKTTDGCQTWKLVFTNPDKDGFWDAIQFDGPDSGMLLGDPVDGNYAFFLTLDGGQTWKRNTPHHARAKGDREAIFAASNSSLLLRSIVRRFFATGGKDGALFFECDGQLEVGKDKTNAECSRSSIPLASGKESTGAFSFTANFLNFVAVGGDYTQPANSSGTAAFSVDNGEHWQAATTPPHGYRSAVAYDPGTKTWITAGPNGTDISTDDGRNWRALEPSPTDAPDADKHWNALSLPFVVGPHGRIGRLRPDALSPTP